MSRFVLFASMDDGVKVNGTPKTRSVSKVQEIRLKLDQSLQDVGFGVGLIQSLHDAARAVEMAVIEHNSSLKTPWLSKAWLGVDRNAWVKTLSYQVDPDTIFLPGFLWHYKFEVSTSVYIIALLYTSSSGSGLLIITSHC